MFNTEYLISVSSVFMVYACVAYTINTLDTLVRAGCIRQGAEYVLSSAILCTQAARHVHACCL